MLPFLYQTDSVTGQTYRIQIVAGQLVWEVFTAPIPVDSRISAAVGIKPAELIEMANKRTERRGKTLNLEKELVIATQEFCQERRWHWRKKDVLLQTLPDLVVYDLSAQNGMAGMTVERICGGHIQNRWQGPKLFRSSHECYDLTPVFETDLQELAREDTQTSIPQQYFLDGQDQFRPIPIPDGVYRVHVPAWVLPDASPMEYEITLVPAYLHHIILKKLESQILRFTLGEGNAKYLAAKAEYEQALFRACTNTDFAEGRIREWKSEEDAIQSS